jgi:hypothetical protein
MVTPPPDEPDRWVVVLNRGVAIDHNFECDGRVRYLTDAHCRRTGATRHRAVTDRKDAQRKTPAPEESHLTRLRRGSAHSAGREAAAGDESSTHGAHRTGYPRSPDRNTPTPARSQSPAARRSPAGRGLVTVTFSSSASHRPNSPSISPFRKADRSFLISSACSNSQTSLASICDCRRSSSCR